MRRPTVAPPRLGFTLGTRIENGCVLLDAAEAGYLHQLLASIMVARSPSYITGHAAKDSGYVQHHRMMQLEALGRIGEPCAFSRVIAAEDAQPGDRGYGRDLHEVDVQLAFVSGGLPPWPKDRRDELDMARAWHETAHLPGNRPDGAAFRIEAAQVRPHGYTTAAERKAQAEQGTQITGRFNDEG